MWSWAVEDEYLPANLLRAIHPDAPPDPVVEPFTQKEVESLLAACERKQTWKTATAGDQPHTERDKAIVYLLLDTGLRASELCAIRLTDLDLNTNSITVVGKGDKKRIVHVGKRTAKALWKLVTPRLGKQDPDAYLFTVGDSADTRPLNRDTLRHLLDRIAERAGVANVYPHRFRHTFAITYLRNGGDLFTLQALLGHSDLEMVRRYARIAQTDCARVHQKASPVDNWRL
ncbi:MAG: tyrosine-type recombinase/integrase [Candidatus Kaiserbacteria bacterium]|nr:tyrosine-type recombinase/integrase [Candidatus Kaiserbacteria bacterium]